MRAAVLQLHIQVAGQARAAGRTGRSGSPWADRDRSSSCGGRWCARRYGSSEPARCAWRTPPPSRWPPAACRDVPGRAGRCGCWARRRSVTSQPQNILVRVLSCTWISTPMTASQPSGICQPCARSDVPEGLTGFTSSSGGTVSDLELLLERVGGVQHDLFAEVRPHELQPHRQPLGEPRGQTEPGQTGQVHRNGA